MSEYNFDSVFNQNLEDDSDFDLMFGAEEDGALIDAVAKESGDVVDADFDEMHNTDTDAEPEDFEDVIGPDDDTDNAPEDAEGTENSDEEELSIGDMAVGESDSEADDFYNQEIDDEPLEGKKPEVDPADIEGDSDSLIDRVIEDCDCDDGDDEEEEDDEFETDGGFIEALLNEADDEEEEYEVGDELLIDLVDQVDGE